jgi:class 3 adenylate cyclase
MTSSVQHDQRMSPPGPSHGTLCRAVALFFLGLWALVNSAGAAVWSVSAATSELALPTLTEVLEDQDGRLTLADVRSPGVEKFFRVADPKDGRPGAAQWLRWTLRNTSDKPLLLWLDTGSRTLQHVDLYWPGAAGTYQHRSTGSVHPFSQRPLPTTTFVFPVDLPAQQDAVMYLRVRSTGYMGVVLSPRLWQPDAYRAHAEREKLLWVLFIGLGIAFAATHLLLYTLTRDVNSILYASSVVVWVFGLCTGAGGYGAAYAYLWPDSPVWNQATWVLSTAFTSNVLCYFLIHLLELDKSQPRLIRVVYLMMAVVALNVGVQTVVTLGQWSGQERWLQWLFTAGGVPWALIFGGTLLGIARSAKAGSRTAKIVLLGFFPTLLAGVLTGYTHVFLGKVYFEFFMAAVVFEWLAMSAAVADRFNQFRRERMQAQKALVVSLKQSEADLERKVAERTNDLELERSRTVSLLHNILPADIAAELSATGSAHSARHEAVSVLFTDFSGFTQAASTMPADRMVAELNEVFAAFDDICDEEGVEKIKTIGDAYMAAAGLPRPCADHAQRCVRVGLRMLSFVERRNASSSFKWRLRVGVHSGPVVAGIVGKRKYAFDIWGDTVNIASRMESAGEPGRVNVSAYTRDLVHREFKCEYRGKVDAKGKGEVDMYFVAPI